MSTKTYHMPFLSKSLLIAGAFVATLLVAAPASAHTSGNWVDGERSICSAICKARDVQPVISAHFFNTNFATKQHYYVCRAKLNIPDGRSGRPGFNISTAQGRCQISGFYSVQDYDCLCM